MFIAGCRNTEYNPTSFDRVSESHWYLRPVACRVIFMTRLVPILLG
jgi:hypothetical protein